MASGTAPAGRGKYAEGKIKAYLKSLEAADFAHHRFPDAHAGSFVTAPADFFACQQGRLTLLEVKQVEHSYRLPHKNFALDQVARMRMWAAAGAKAQVVIYFVPEKLWRSLPLDYFFIRTGGSWDMRDVPLQTLQQTMGELFVNT